jgi:hypothetical protein
VNVKGGCFFRETTPFFKILNKRNVMANRKHKPKQAAHQKVEQAQHRNEFMLHFKKWIDDLANYKVSQLIPKQEYDRIFLSRFQSIKIYGNKTHTVNDTIINEFKDLHIGLIKHNQASLLNNDKKVDISFYNYFTIVLTIYSYVKFLKDTEYAGAALLKYKLAPILNYFEKELNAMVLKDYHDIISILAIMHGNLQTKLIAYHLEFKEIQNGNYAPKYHVELTGLEPEKIQVIMDGHNRPAYRLGIVKNGKLPHLIYTTINATDLGLTSNQQFGVYIQAHAFHRLAERVDGINVGILHFNLYHSFKNIQVHSDKHGGYLFEFSINQIKVGYFKGEIIGENIVLRTFLFLTNNGTPEGKKLHANIGIMKEDKIYLTIDKLSTFVNSDIASNERLKQVFIDAGCESLFRIDKNFFYEEGGVKTKTIADHITRYLKLDA